MSRRQWRLPILAGLLSFGYLAAAAHIAWRPPWLVAAVGFRAAIGTVAGEGSFHTRGPMGALVGRRGEDSDRLTR
jgi:hypothetical protein